MSRGKSMEKSDVDFLIFLDSGISDVSLDLFNNFIPELIKNRIEEKFPQSGIFFSIPADYSGKLNDYQKTYIRNSTDDLIFWKDLFEKTGSSNIAVIKADSPFIDPEILEEMIQLHLTYLSEFTFSENLPEGYCCEIISGELIKQLPETTEETLPLSKVVRTNINQFDVELFYKDPDIRDKRLNFRTSSPREKKILEKIYSINNKIPFYSEIKSLIDNNPEVLYTGPSYVEIEITGECSLDCIFCYRKTLKNEHPHMDKKILEKILTDLRSFNLPYTLCFGGSGEPLDHPEFYSFMDMVIQEPLAEMLIIETNGIKTDNNFKTYLSKPEASKIITVINNNSFEKESYISLHGKDSFNTVLDNIISLSALNGDNTRVFIQVMKINETDTLENEKSQKSFLDRYYDFWEGHKIPRILQKQNTYFGRIKDRRYSDLSPVKRGTCWHLQRDLYILSDGTAAFCKQDVDGEFNPLSLNEYSLTEIWEQRKKLFIENYKGNYPEKPDCKNCDEWYTFNF